MSAYVRKSLTSSTVISPVESRVRSAQLRGESSGVSRRGEDRALGGSSVCPVREKHRVSGLKHVFTYEWLIVVCVATGLQLVLKCFPVMSDWVNKMLGSSLKTQLYNNLVREWIQQTICHISLECNEDEHRCSTNEDGWNLSWAQQSTLSSFFNNGWSCEPKHIGLTLKFLFS